MNTTISSDQFSDTMKLTMQEMSRATSEAMKKAVNATTKEIRQKTKDNSPVRTGKYQRSWKDRLIKGNASQYGRVVYNSPEYRLTHLLQHGHGGPFPARAFPHIPSDDETEALFIKNLKAEIET